MGGDNPPQHFFSAILEAASQLNSDYNLLVIATKNVVDDLSSYIKTNLTCHHGACIDFLVAADFIAMDEEPLKALRRKKGASLILGVDLLKKNQLDAFVSCGNTGALIASAALSLPLLPGILRPALLVPLPTKKGPVAVLDVGGSVSCKAQHLIQFAHLGAAYQQAMYGIEVPAVGLLNNGIESKKGTVELQQVYESLRTSCLDTVARGTAPKMNFVGNIEGRDVFTGVVDVLITDGFTGNILLKTAEGVASFIFDALEGIVEQSASENIREEFSSLKKQFNYTEYPGALICGIDSVIIKVHGNASAQTMLVSLLSAADCLHRKVIEKIAEKIL